MTSRLRPFAGVQVFDFDDFGTPFALDRVPAIIEELAVEMTMAPLWWGHTEKADGVYDWSHVECLEALAAKMGRLPALIWSLYPISMNKRGPLPEDVRDLPFDSLRMLDRFEGYVQAVARRAPWSTPDSVVLVGNEIDTWAHDHADEVDAFATFSDHAAEAIRTAAPGVRVVNTFTHRAIETAAGRDMVRALSRSMDLIGFQWYDNKPDGSVDGSRTLAEELERWEEVAGGKPLIIPEIGLATGAACASSEELQVEHIDQLFDVLASRDRDQLVGAVWLGLHDWDRALLTEWVAGQFPVLAGNDTFLSYLTTLGLRRQDDTPKLGYGAWAQRAQAHRTLVPA